MIDPPVAPWSYFLETYLGEALLLVITMSTNPALGIGCLVLLTALSLLRYAYVKGVVIRALLPPDVLGDERTWKSSQKRTFIIVPLVWLIVTVVYALAPNDDGPRLGFALAALLAGALSYGWLIYRICALRCSVEARARFMQELDLHFALRMLAKQGNVQR